MWFAIPGALFKAGTGIASNWEGCTQNDLMEALLARDETAFSWLVQKHWPRMHRVARGLLGSESLASEVVQETWEAIFKELPRFRGESSLGTWIYRILINRAHRVGKREARTIPFSGLSHGQESEQEMDRTDEFTSNGRWQSPVHGWRMLDPQNEVMVKEGLKILAEGLEQLPENQRIVVTMRDVEGLASKEVCKMLEISEGNQRILLHRGRTRLRQMLEKTEAQVDASTSNK